MVQVIPLASLAFSAIGFVAASPAPIPQTSIPDNNDRLLALNDAQQKFKGIYWDEASTTCSPSDFADLVQTVSDSVDIVNQLSGDWIHGAAFNRFFVRPGHTAAAGDWYGIGTSNQNFWEALMSNIKNVQDFPKNSRPNNKGQIPRSRQVGLSCKDRTKKQNCSKGNVGAVTTYDASTGGWWISVCPIFFKKPHHRDNTNGRARKPNELALLQTKELIMIHEWMHVNNMGFTTGLSDKKPTGESEIEDIKDDLPNAPGTQIYGAEACHQYAWLNAAKSMSKVNVKAIMNADNYAWFFTAYSYALKWNWSDNMSDWDIKSKRSRTPVPRDADDLQPDPDSVVSGSSINTNGAAETLWNCQGFLPGSLGLLTNDPEHVHCDYIGLDYAESIDASKQAFESFGNCTLSSACWKSASNSSPSKDCVCTCGTAKTDLKDPKCAGFAGDVNIAIEGTATPSPTPTPTPSAAPAPSSTACPTGKDANNPAACKACPKGFLGLDDPGTKCETKKNSVGFSQVICVCNDPCGKTSCNLYG